MIKKVFVGVFLAIVFGLLVLGAVNRTLAKNDDTEPLALSKNLSEGNDGANINQNKNQSVNKSLENNLYLRGQDNGRGSNDCDGEQYSDGTEYRKGAEEQGNRSGTTQGGQPEGMPGDGLGVGQAEVDEQMTEIGTVVSVSADLLVIELPDGSQLDLEGRVLSFLIEQGFSIVEGDELTITGFYESDNFEVIQILNDTSGENISVRDQNGRPLWAGGRQQGGGNN
mgnify:CR=1 FL=1